MVQAQSVTPVPSPLTASSTSAQTVRKRNRAVLSTLIYMLPVILSFLAFAYVPFFQSLWLSLNITDATGTAVKFNGLNYYARILNLEGKGDEYLRSLLISFRFVLLSVPLGILLGLGLAVLAAVKLKHIKIFRTIFTSSIAISLASASIIWSLIYSPAAGVLNWLVELLQLKQAGLLNNAATALTAIALVSVWSSLGFNFIITLSGIQAIPQDVYESGAIDGATGWRSFRHITLPLLSPTLLFLLVVNTIGSFQAFTQFNVLVQGEGPESSTNVFVYATFKAFWYDNRYGFSSAMAMVLFVVLFALTFIQFRGLDKRVHYQ